MKLAERCDEIVRLIDATLAEFTASDRAVPAGLADVAPDLEPPKRAPRPVGSPGEPAASPRAS